MLKLFFTGALFLLVYTANSQMQIGIKAGVNVSNFTGDNFGGFEPEPLTSPHGGLFLRWRFGTHLALQPEILFSVQGAKIKDASNTEQDYKASYVNIPIMLQYHFNGGFYIEGGPQVGFKVDEDFPGSTDDVLKSNDVSLGLGLGYTLKGGLGINARYVMGLTSLEEDSDDDMKNGVWQFSLFYTFFNKGK